MGLIHINFTMGALFLFFGIRIFFRGSDFIATLGDDVQGIPDSGSTEWLLLNLIAKYYGVARASIGLCFMAVAIGGGDAGNRALGWAGIFLNADFMYLDYTEVLPHLDTLGMSSGSFNYFQGIRVFFIVGFVYYLLLRSDKHKAGNKEAGNKQD